MPQYYGKTLDFYNDVEKCRIGLRKQVIDIALNERRNHLLVRLLNTDCLTTIQTLAESFKVSQRTVRYDLDALDDFLVSQGLPKLLRKQHGGVRFAASLAGKKKALHLLRNLGIYQYALTAVEREIILTGQLMHHKDYMTIDELAARLLVSRNTIIKDLHGVKAWYAQRGLELRSFPKYGIKVIGDEKNLRQAAIHFIKETIGMEKMIEIAQGFTENSQYGVNLNDCFHEWFCTINFEIIQTSVKEIEKKLKTMFSDAAFAGLVLYIAVAIKRIQLGRDVVMPDEELQALQSTRAFSVAYEAAHQVGKHLGTDISLDEVGYLTEHILGSSVLSSAVDEQVNRTELDMLVCNLIAEVSRRLKQDLISDRQLFRGLLNELRPYLYRLKYGLAFEPSAVEEIKSSYETLFKIVQSSTKPIEEYANGKLMDDEIAHLTLHFGAALERIKPQDKGLTCVLVVCAAGLGTASLLASKLQSVFDVCVVDIVARHQANRILAEKHVDLIVSTVEFKETAIPSVTVSPLLPPHDMAALKNYINSVKTPHTLLERTLKIIEQHCVIRNYDQLYDDLASQFDADLAKSDNSHRLPALKDLLTSDMMALDVEAADWAEAIRTAGHLLYRKGIIEESYIAAMIDVVNKMGPYIVLWEGVALPHASTEHGVNQVGISFIRLKKPVRFGHPQNDPVKLVFALAAVDSSTHVMALLELTRMLSDTELVKVLSCLPDSRQVEEFIALNSNSESI